MKKTKSHLQRYISKNAPAIKAHAAAYIVETAISNIDALECLGGAYTFCFLA